MNTLCVETLNVVNYILLKTKALIQLMCYTKIMHTIAKARLKALVSLRQYNEIEYSLGTTFHRIKKPDRECTQLYIIEQTK